MKKVLKIFIIILLILVSIVLIDTFQAKVFANRPFIRITKSYNEGNVLKKDKGIFVYTYIFTNGKKVTVYRWEKYSPPIQSNSETEKEALERKKISASNLKSDNANINILIKFNNILYGKSYGIIDYAGDLNKSIGTIDYVIDEEYIPLINGETNKKEYLNAKVLTADNKTLILNYNNEAILFLALKEN